MNQKVIDFKETLENRKVQKEAVKGLFLQNSHLTIHDIIIRLFNPLLFLLEKRY